MPVSLSLKQKLSALALSPSSPTSPTGDSAWPSSPKSPKSRSVFSNWGRRPDEGSSRADSRSRSEHVDEIMGRVIFQAGVDYETRPMVVISAAAWPDAREVSYDLLLSRVLSYLDLYVESDYTVVFLAAGSRHHPGWNWVWKAYRSLSRKYRKNLKKLFIVHPSWFSKMLFSLAGAFISPKFFRKIHYVATLSALAEQVPLTQIDIPSEVYQENLKHEKQITLPVPSQQTVFGVSLETLMGIDGEKAGIPRVIKDCVQYLREYGMEEEGIFRRSPHSVLLRQVQEAYERGHPVSLSSFGDPNIPAVLLKKFFRDLPESFFGEELYPLIRKCPPPSDDPSDFACPQYIREHILTSLRSQAHVILLGYVVHLMHDVALRSSVNKMDAHNLALVFAPCLAGRKNPVRDVQMCTIPGGPTLWTGQATEIGSLEGKVTLGLVLKICIQRYYDIFDDLPERGEATSSIPTSVPASTSGSATPDHDDDEDVDDAMLVMPIGPSTSTTSVASAPPSAYKQRKRAPTAHSANNSMRAGPGSTLPKPRSLISIEKGTSASGTRGTITLGKGTARKSSGAAVEAFGITASGFFAPPSAPPVPPLPNKSSHAKEETVKASRD